MVYAKTTGRLTAALFALSLISAPSALAYWAADGNPVCTAADEQAGAQAVSDGLGGAIVAWQDHRGGYFDIYAQRVDSLGNVKWTTDGVAVCAALNQQWSPTLAPDGAGGVVVAWYDGRDLGYHVYVQRLDSSGASRWNADGVAVCTAAGFRQPAEIVSDGAGGAILAWSDYRSGVAVAYAQRVDSSGAVRWTPDGVLICNAPAGDQRFPQLVPDGAGGAVIVWDDDRLGFPCVYAQRVDPLGAVKWDTSSVAVCVTDSPKGDPKIGSDGAGGVVVAWADSVSGCFNVYAQRVDSSGAVKWAVGGVRLRGTAAEQRRPQIVADGLGGAVAVWEDSLSGSWDIYAQRIDPSGGLQWTASAAEVCVATGEQSCPRLLSDGAGGAMVFWQDCRTGEWDVYGQRLGVGGSSAWALNGEWVCRAASDQQRPAPSPDGAAGAIVVWEDLRGADSDIYAKRVTPDYTTPVVFASASARVEAGTVVLTWRVCADVPGPAFLVRRADAPGGSFADLDLQVRKEDAVEFSCTDNSVISGRTYWYEIVLLGTSGGEVYGPIEVYVGASPAVSRVYQSHPNPSNPACTIRYELARPGRMRLAVFDVSGSLVRTVAEGWRDPGAYSELWDGRRDDGTEAAPGVYLYRLETGDFRATRKMVLFH